LLSAYRTSNAFTNLEGVFSRRIYESLDYVPPVEFDAHYYDSSQSENLAAMEMI